jgi:hypothetical protein
LDRAAEGAEAEAMTRGRVGVFVGTDGEGAIPVRDPISARYRKEEMKSGNLYKCRNGEFVSADFRELLRRIVKFRGMAV